MPTPPQPSAPPPHRDPALDGLRGLAVLLVFLFHYGGGLRAHNPLLRAVGYLTQAGWIGVDVFFALSGLLITGLLADSLLAADPEPPTSVPAAGTPLWRKPAAPGHTSQTWVSASPGTPAIASKPVRTALGHFYARRALRILPLYFVALLACAGAAVLRGASLSDLKPLLVYAAFLQNFPPLLKTALHTPPPLPVFHLWSLAVEEQFYLLWPFALLAARTPRRALHLSLLTFVASCLFRGFLFAPHLLSWETASSFATLLPTRAGALALGSALALYQRPFRTGSASATVQCQTASSCLRHPDVIRSTDMRQSVAAVLVAVALILLAAVYTHNLLLNSRPAFVLTLPAADVFSAALVALCLHPTVLRTALSTPVLTFLGRISYGFYVLHILLEPLFDELGALLTQAHSGFVYQAVRFLIALLITTAAAWVSFVLLERPCLRLKRRFPRSSASAV